MELLYIWIKEYNNIKEEGFNFSPRYWFKFDEKTNTLTCEKRKPELAKLFDDGNIVNVTAIVGENGTGKSSLLDKLKTLGNTGNPFGEVIFIFGEKENDINIINNLKEKITFITTETDIIVNGEKVLNKIIESSNKEKYEEIIMPPSKIQDTVTDTFTIFYSPIIDFRKNIYGDAHEKLIDISSNEFLYKEGLELHKLKDIERQLNLISYIENNDKELKSELEKINVPEKCKLRFSSSRTDNFLNEMDKKKLEELENEKHSYEKKWLGLTHKIIVGIKHEMPNDEMKNDYEKLKDLALNESDNTTLKGLVSDIPKNIDDINRIVGEEYEKIKKIYADFLKEKPNERIKNAFKNNISSHIKQIDKYYDHPGSTKVKLSITDNLEIKVIEGELLSFTKEEKPEVILEQLNDAISSFSDVLEKIEFGTIEEENFIDFLNRQKRFFYFDVDINLAKSIAEKYVRYLNTIQNVTEIRDIHNFLEFDWRDMSSGEKAFLNLYSRLWDAKKQMDRKEKKGYNYDFIYLLIDEGEMGFHPQWQKAYLKRLIDFVKVAFEGKKVQIIMTSHSPFLVSDLPKENVIFLEKGCNNKCKVAEPNLKRTFAENIHTLLANSFFMENGLVGEFAREKIRHIIDLMDKGKIKGNEDYIEAVIECIGEPILRHTLQKKYDRATFSAKTLDVRITKLEKELKALKEKSDIKLS